MRYHRAHGWATDFLANTYDLITKSNYHYIKDYEDTDFLRIIQGTSKVEISMQNYFNILDSAIVCI